MSCYNNFDIGGCGCGTTICVSVCSPSLPVFGALVELISGGVTVASCTTPSTGCCAFTQSGTYTVKVTVGGVVCHNASHTLAGTTIGISITSCSTAVICCGGYAIPATLTGTDASGTFAFLWCSSCSGSFPTWTGGISVPSLTSCSVTTPGGACVVANPTSGPVRVCYTMICHGTSTPKFAVQRAWSYVFDPVNFNPIWYQDPSGFVAGSACVTAPPGPCGSPLTDTASFAANPSSTAPFALSGTPAASGSNSTADPVGGSVAFSA